MSERNRRRQGRLISARPRVQALAIKTLTSATGILLECPNAANATKSKSSNHDTPARILARGDDSLTSALLARVRSNKQRNEYFIAMLGRHMGATFANRRIIIPEQAPLDNFDKRFLFNTVQCFDNDYSFVLDTFRNRRNISNIYSVQICSRCICNLSKFQRFSLSTISNCLPFVSHSPLEASKKPVLSENYESLHFGDNSSVRNERARCKITFRFEVHWSMQLST